MQQKFAWQGGLTLNPKPETKTRQSAAAGNGRVGFMALRLGV